jgi:CopC domain-containing protein
MRSTQNPVTSGRASSSEYKDIRLVAGEDLNLRLSGYEAEYASLAIRISELPALNVYRSLLLIALAAAVAWAAVAAADAHARLDHASPAAGSAARRPPREVTLWFTQKVKPRMTAATRRAVLAAEAMTVLAHRTTY